MISLMGFRSSICDKQTSPGHGNGHQGHPHKWKGRG